MAAEPAHTGPKKRAAEHTADRLRARILRGDIEAGTDLPAERELAERLSVSRLTVRAAIARLEAEGLVRPVHGSGTRVLDFRETGGVELMAHLAQQSLQGGEVPLAVLRDLLELRRIVAIELIGLVTERATADEIAALREHVREQRRYLDDPPRFMQADLTFARLLVRAGDNLALELLLNTILRILDAHPGMELAFMANAEQTLAVYDKILDLIEARDAERVRTFARRLLDRLDRATVDRIQAVVEPAETSSASASDSDSDSQAAKE